MSITIKKYQPENATHWNAFLKKSINGTFLFDRSFMDYHSDRFDDHSLMIYEEDQLIGIVPAHTKENCFYSHRGLTYGIPVVLENKTRAVIVAVLEYLDNSAFAKAEFNLTPQHYHKDNYILSSKLVENGFKIGRILHNMSVDLKANLNISSKKSIGYRNGKFENLKIERGADFKSFWELVLVPSLRARHNSMPVHSLEEIELLASRFPNHIIQHNVYSDQELLAGITFFIKGKVIKSQYAASSPAGMKTDAVGYIYIEAMKEYKHIGYHVMDLGPVNTSDGSINEGLYRFKKQLGSEMEEVLRLEKAYK
ncbi:hypothetical protein [Nonlabens sp.]|uniref:hypothetical protein n=1 Tax=Nonlabens sp. TaxID=1888209 RepID=UPI003F69A3EB